MVRIAPLILLLCLLSLWDGLELVADAVARLDERVTRRSAVDLVAEAADEGVDGAVPMQLAAAPDPLQQLVACRHAAAVEGERVEEPELGRGQLRTGAVDVGLHLARVDPQLLDLDRLAALLRLGAEAAP